MTSTKKIISITLDSETIQILQNNKSKFGIPVSRQVEDALKKSEGDSHD